jgi:hypothetical protein
MGMPSIRALTSAATGSAQPTLQSVADRFALLRRILPVEVLQQD